MSEIIWDSQSLESIVAMLRRAASELDDQCAALRSIRVEMGETFKGNTGVSRRIMEKADAVIQRTSRLGERADVLAGGVERASELFAAAERSIAGLAEGAGGGNTPGIRAVARESFLRIPNVVIMVGTPQSVSGVTPEWLATAAEKAFSQR
ncbi:MAG: hypothetical protein LUG57_03215 [Oscillospiraceae bacterium]|nr:hypothetical protein [Oscillospiraceae bacterium]